MTENFNPHDPFGWNEAEYKQPEITRWQRFKWTVLANVLAFVFHGADRAIKEREHRKKHYRHVIKQGWFGEYSEWHER